MRTRDYLIGAFAGITAMVIVDWTKRPATPEPYTTQRIAACEDICKSEDIAACRGLCKSFSGIHAIEFIEGHEPACVCNNGARYFRRD